MECNAIATVKDFFDRVNSRFGLSVECEITEGDKDKYPLCVRDGNLLVIPEFFDHPELSEKVKLTMIAEIYSYFYIDKHKTGHIDINPGFMAKGICDELGFTFVSDNDIEAELRNIRRKLYDDIENACYFEIGSKLRESAFAKYEVVDICRRTPTETIITVKPIGRRLGNPEIQFTEEELLKRCSYFRDLSNERVSMRRNLFVISGPSGVGKDSVVKELIKQFPENKKTISVTTRAPRSSEKDGVDYYFITKEKLSEYRVNDQLAEYELYDGSFYGTLYSEIERHAESTPLILVVDVRGRRNIMMRYPLTKSIFISPPSFETLKQRIIDRKENTADEIEHRLTVSKDELDEAVYFDYVVTNKDIKVCADEIAKIITSNK